PDGRVGEIFITADKGGSLARGSLDAVGMLCSVLLQHGTPLTTVISKLKSMRFPPEGFTGDQEIPSCYSPLDLLARWLAKRFLPKEEIKEEPKEEPKPVEETKTS